MGSAPVQKAANRGIDERQVKLGCVQPGEAVATFGDSLRRLTDKATYRYVDGKRYWYSTQPTHGAWRDATADGVGPGAAVARRPREREAACRRLRPVPVPAAAEKLRRAGGRCCSI